MASHAAKTRKASKPVARARPKPVGVTQVAREALSDVLGMAGAAAKQVVVVLRGAAASALHAAQQALAVARDVGMLAVQALRQIVAGTTTGVSEVIRSKKPAFRRAAAKRA